MKRNWISAMAGLSVLAASAMAAAAPQQYDARNRGGQRGGAVTQGRGGYNRPAPTYSRPMAVRPNYDRPAYTRPMHTRPVYNQPAYTRPMHTRPVYNRPAYNRPAFVNRGYGRPLVLTRHHRGWISRLSSLRASAYRFVQYRHYSLGARQAELARLESELAAIQANQAWLTSYGDYSELVRHILAVRASLGVYAPAPLADLSMPS